MNGTEREKEAGSHARVPKARARVASAARIHPPYLQHPQSVHACVPSELHLHTLPTKMIAVAPDTLQYAYGLPHRHAATSPSPSPRLAGTRVSHTIFLPVRLRPCRDTQACRPGPPMQETTRQARKPLLFHGTRGACQDFPTLRFKSSVW